MGYDNINSNKRKDNIFCNLSDFKFTIHNNTLATATCSNDTLRNKEYKLTFHPTDNHNWCKKFTFNSTIALDIF